MRTKNLLVIAFVLISTVTFAQNGRVSVGAELAIPGGDYGDGAGTGFGGSLRYEHPVGDNLGLMLTVGYLTYGTKEEDFGFGISYKYTNSMIPIMVGGKYYFSEQQDGFYANLQLGLTMLNTKAEFEFLGVSESETNSTSAFTWSPGIGYALENLDFSVNYFAFSYSQESTYTDPFSGASTTVETDYSGSWIGLRVAYVFGER
jgi:hypothetical protein